MGELASRRNKHTARFGILILFFLAASCMASVLDRGAWKITIVPDKAAIASGLKEFSDTLTFAEGKFGSVALSAKGFRPVAYRGDFEEGEAEFEAEQVSDTEGVAIWLGEIRGDRIVGRLQFRKKDGTNLAFNFSGTRTGS
jgi:hypothetical protein